jgi:O-antigen/teichoic acid export membrane protein
VDARGERETGVASHTIARNSAFAALDGAVTALLSVAVTLFLVRELSPSGYGVYALALAIGALIALPMDLGISGSAGRFVAENRGRQDEIAGILADALRLKIATAGAFGLVLVAVAGPIADAYGTPGLAWPIRGVALALVAASLMQLFRAALIAQGRMQAGFLMSAVQSAVGAAAVIGLVLAGAGATGAAFGRAAGFCAGLAVGAAVMVRLFGRSSLAVRVGRGRTGAIARYAGPLAIVDGAYNLFDQLDLLLIGAYLSAASVGLFQAPLSLTVFLFYPAGIVATAVAPRVTGHRGRPPNLDAFRVALRLLVVGYAATIAPLVVWAGPITHLLLGPKYGASADVLRALAPFVFLAGVGSLLAHSANYLGQAARRMPLALGAVAINALIDVILIPRIGIIAGAIGSSAALALYVPGHLWICARVIDVPLRPLALTLGRSLLAASAMAGVLFLAGTSHLSVGAWLAGAVGGLLAYAAVLLATREVSVDELRVALRLAARRRLRQSGQPRGPR